MVKENQLYKFLSNAGFYLSARNPLTVQLELIGLPLGVWGPGISFGHSKYNEEAMIADGGRFSIGLKCYLMIYLAYEMVEASGLVTLELTDFRT